MSFSLYLSIFESMLPVQDHHILSHIWYQHQHLYPAASPPYTHTALIKRYQAIINSKFSIGSWSGKQHIIANQKIGYGHVIYFEGACWFANLQNQKLRWKFKPNKVPQRLPPSSSSSCGQSPCLSREIVRGSLTVFPHGRTGEGVCSLT